MGRPGISISNKNPVWLGDMIRQLPGWADYREGSAQAVAGVVYDSRQVKQNYIFVALQGGNTDGHRFISDAIERGAVAIIGTQTHSGLPAPYFQVQDSRLALAILSAAFYEFPAQKLTVIGVTGTDGKTTTSNLIYHILRAGGLRVGMITTVNAVIGERTLDTGFHVTTPEAPDVQRYLAQMVEANLDYVILEATSHGLDQQRVAACDFDIGVVTNITHEHIDYHGTFEAYRAAKARLFTSLADASPKRLNPPRAAVLNLDDESYAFLSARSPVRQITYGLNPTAQVTAKDIHFSETGTSFTVIGLNPGGKIIKFPVQTNLLGEFNISNCLAAIAVGIGIFDLNPEHVQRGIARLSAVPGRMERIDFNQDDSPIQDFIAFVDFAHTPNALQQALQTVRQLTTGRVIAVFGSAGLRDRLKRRLMAEVSTRKADLTIFTAEDPRTESLTAILAEMADGANSQGGIEGQTYWRIADRRVAIRFAINLARPGDVVIACGKGHEQSMCFGDIEYAWDDRIAMRAALAERLGVPGPQMPFLPAV
jgi:UDP-N-acetylmuramoyl-L-alanyl-D-glutamate--2,6-diaminopimelate ligase